MKLMDWSRIICQTLWEFQEIFEGHCGELKSLSELVKFMGPHLYSQATKDGEH